MPSFEDITIVAIHGNNKIESMIPAVERTAMCLPGARTLLISNINVESNIPQKLVYQELDYEGYSHFVIYCLHQYIETDYVLIVQDDGWALNAENWNCNWFQYDYIGALTHAALVGNQFITNYAWKFHDNAMVVQNGGFSFRSRALLEAPSKYGIVMHIKPHSMLNAEDVQLCCFMKPALEKIGLRFASHEDSMMFAFEHLDLDVHKNVNLEKVFGMHSNFRKLVSKDTIQYKISEDRCSKIIGESQIVDLLKSYNYNFLWSE